MKRSSKHNGYRRILVLSALIFISVIAFAFIPRRFVSSESFTDGAGATGATGPIDPPIAAQIDPIAPPVLQSTTGPTYNNNVTVNSPSSNSVPPTINSLNGHVRTVITYDDNDYYVRKRSLYPYYDGSIPTIYAPGPPMPSSANWWWWPSPYSQDTNKTEDSQTKSDMTNLFIGAAVGAGIAAVLIAVGGAVVATSHGKK